MLIFYAYNVNSCIQYYIICKKKVVYGIALAQLRNLAYSKDFTNNSKHVSHSNIDLNNINCYLEQIC